MHCTQDNEHQVRCNYLAASAALRLTAKTNSGQITDTRLALPLWLLLALLHNKCRQIDQSGTGGQFEQKTLSRLERD